MLGWAGHSALEGGEVGGDAVDVKVNKGLLAFFGEEEGAVGGMNRFSVRAGCGGALTPCR